MAGGRLAGFPVPDWAGYDGGPTAGPGPNRDLASLGVAIAFVQQQIGALDGAGS
jgi:hypothetical protein